MYYLYNINANNAYTINAEWYFSFHHIHVKKTESVWMVPGSVDPLED